MIVAISFHSDEITCNCCEQFSLRGEIPTQLLQAAGFPTQGFMSNGEYQIIAYTRVTLKRKVKSYFQLHHTAGFGGFSITLNPKMPSKCSYLKRWHTSPCAALWGSEILSLALKSQIYIQKCRSRDPGYLQLWKAFVLTSAALSGGSWTLTSLL